MKKIKIILLSISLVFVSGCVSKYELEIDGNEFSETVTTHIYAGDREFDLYEGIESGNRIDAYVDRDVYPFFANYDYIYEKNVKKIDDYEQVELKYNYTDNEYKDSNAVNLCFENRNFNIEKNYYDIDLSGYFYCLYNNETLDIIIKTKNKVIDNNADEVIKNKYIWHITQDNFKDVSIKFQVSKKKEINNLYLYAIISLVIITLITVLILFLKIKKKNNEI